MYLDYRQQAEPRISGARNLPNCPFHKADEATQNAKCDRGNDVAVLSILTLRNADRLT